MATETVTETATRTATTNAEEDPTPMSTTPVGPAVRDVRHALTRDERTHHGVAEKQRNKEAEKDRKS